MRRHGPFVGLILASFPLFSQAQPPAAATRAETAVSTSTPSLPPGRPITLKEAFDLALAQSEALAQRAATVEQLNARIDEMWAAVQPNISLVGSIFVQEGTAQGGAVSGSLRQDKEDLRLSLHQPVFTGLREFLAVKVAKGQSRSAGLDYQRAKDLLFSDVAQAYHDLLASHQQIGILRSVVGITEDRIRELKERQRIGRSRKSEVLAAESQLAQNQADLTQAFLNERNAQQSLRFLTGLSEDLDPAPLSVPPAGPLEGFLTQARERADVQARREDLEAARVTVAFNERARWPVVAFDANHYIRRLGTFSGVRWDLTLSGSIPLWEGGAISARVRQAQALQRSAQEGLSLVIRTAQTQTRTAYEDLQAQLSVVAALEKAAAMAEANTKAQTADYRLGLVTNLDVLGALTSQQSVMLRLVQSRVDSALQRLRLDIAAGGVSR